MILAAKERAVDVDLPLAINPFLQNRQLEMLNGNLVYLLLPLAKALLLVRQHGPSQSHVLGIHLQLSLQLEALVS